MFILIDACGRGYPSYTGTVDVTLNPLSTTNPDVLPYEYRPNIELLAMWSLSTLNVSKRVSASLVLLFFDDKGDSVINIDISSGTTFISE